LVVIATPLALLPIGYKLEMAGQYLVAMLAVIIFIPIPILFIPMTDEGAFYSVYALLWSGMLVISLASRVSLKTSMRTITEEQFTGAFYVLLVVCVAALLYSARSGLSFATLSAASRERPVQYDLNAFQSYSTTMFVGSFGGFLLTMAIFLRRYLVMPLVLAGFVLAYGIMIIKFAALAPAWIAYTYVMQRLFFKRSMVRFCFTLVAPFMLLSLAVLAFNPVSGSWLSAIFLITNWRLLVIPAAAFNVYYDYFLLHPFTYWSHINLVQLFVHYPYGESIADLMGDQYNMGTYNASFIMGDGIAALGVAGIPVICGVFSLVLVGINTCFRGINQLCIAMLLAVPSIWLINVPLFTTLFTGGLGLLSILMLFAPRDASWSAEK
jgi:hypothetical protein